MISAYASKRLSWGDSYDARACIAIGMKNSPMTYERSVLDAVGAPRMPPVLEDKFIRENKQRISKNEKKKTEEERRKYKETMKERIILLKRKAITDITNKKI